MFTLKGFVSPEHRNYKANPHTLNDDFVMDREVFEGNYYQICRIADDHVAVMYSDPSHPSFMGQLHVGPGKAFWRVIIENQAGTNVEKIQVTDADNNWVSF